MNKWSVVHNYRKAIQRGKASPITCPECAEEYIWTPDKNNDPALYCLACSSTVYIGLDVWNQIEKVLNEA